MALGIAALCWVRGAKDVIRFLPLQKNVTAKVQQAPPCTPLGRPGPLQHGALRKVSTPQPESDPFADLTVETGLDEAQEHSWASFSFGKENQTGMRRIPLMAGCRDFAHTWNAGCAAMSVL